MVEKRLIPALKIEVEAGQIVDVPKHRVLGVDGIELELDCSSEKGEVFMYGGIPKFRYKVQCLSANDIDAKIQCLRTWNDED